MAHTVTTLDAIVAKQVQVIEALAPTIPHLGLAFRRYMAAATDRALWPIREWVRRGNLGDCFRRFDISFVGGSDRFIGAVSNGHAEERQAEGELVLCYPSTASRFGDPPNTLD